MKRALGESCAVNPTPFRERSEKESYLKAEEKAPRGPLGEIAVCPQQLDI